MGEETPPNRFCKHKGHIAKVMCLATMARLRQNPKTKEWWDGKHGTWFFTHCIAAHSSSKNCPAGTLEKPINMSRKTFVDKSTNELMPTIEIEWPLWSPKNISI